MHRHPVNQSGHGEVTVKIQGDFWQKQYQLARDLFRNFPAACKQPPFFLANLDAAVDAVQLLMWYLCVSSFPTYKTGSQTVWPDVTSLRDFPLTISVGGAHFNRDAIYQSC